MQSHALGGLSGLAQSMVIHTTGAMDWAVSVLLIVNMSSRHLPEVVLSYATDCEHLADFTTDTFDAEPHLGALLDDLVGVVREGWCRSFHRILELSRNHLDHTVSLKCGLAHFQQIILPPC